MLQNIIPVGGKSMNLIKIAFVLSLVGSFPLFGMQLASKNSGTVKTHQKSKETSWQTLKNVSRINTKEDIAVVRGPNAREFAVIALRISDSQVQEKAVGQLLQTPNARETFLKDIRSENAARAVNVLGQVSFLVEHSNKRRLSLVSDDEEKCALEDRIQKSKRLFKASPYQEEFFWMSDEQRTTMSKLSKHFDPSLGSSVPTSINLSRKEWEDLSGISRQLRGEFRTHEDYFKGHLMPEAGDKVAYVAQKLAQDTLLGVAPGGFGGWISQMGGELGNVVLSDQVCNTAITAFGEAAHGTMHNAVNAAEQLALDSLSQKDQSIHKLSKVIGTFGANFPEDAQNGLIETFTRKGPEMVGDAAITALDNPGAILGSTSMMICIGAGATSGLVKGITGMNNPVVTKNITQI